MAIILSVVLLLVGIVLLLLIHFFISGRASRRDGRGSMVERGTNGARRMSMHDLEKLPCYDYIAKDITSSPVDCAVCLESLTTGDKCRLLPMCNHSFHAQCVDTWLLKTPLCPICRSSAGSHSGSQVRGNNEYFIEPSNQSRGSQSTNIPSQLDDNRAQLRESLESGPSINVGIELRENPTLGSPSSGHTEVESRGHQMDTTDNHMISATTLSQAIAV